MQPTLPPEFDAVIDEFTDRLNRGERPRVEEYAARHPAHEAELREILGMLAALGPLRSGDTPLTPNPAGRTTPHGSGAPTPAVPGFEILGELGRGGMGVVYQARQTSLNRVVALKVILTGAHATDAARSRFAAEATVLAALDHPHVVKVFDFGTHDGNPYFALEYVPGGTLESLLTAGPLPPSDAARLVEQLAGAIAHTHAAGVVHRDLKPGNVLLAGEREPKITDFGLARDLTAESGLTATGAIVGTPSYMAPEQADGRAPGVGPAADVYALGAILYECLTARPPFRGATVLDTLEQVKKHDPVAVRDLQPGVPRDLETICLKCLQKDPARRYATAGDLADDLRRFLDGKPVTAGRPSQWYKARKFVRRNRGPVAATAVVAVALLGGVAAVVAVQARANRDLTTKNAVIEARNKELADEQAKVEARNRELADEQAKVQARFELALKAIGVFHTGVSEDVLLRNDQFTALRTKLLKEAFEFYVRLEGMLAGQTDARSREALAVGYFQLGYLTERIGSKPAALVAYGKSLTTRLALADTHPGVLQYQRSLGWTHNTIGILLGETGKPADALAAHQKALAIRQALADDNPTVPELQNELAKSHIDIGNVLREISKPIEGLTAYRKALGINQALVNANPTVAEYQTDLAACHANIGNLLREANKLADALVAYRKAADILQPVADVNPTVARHQTVLARTYENIASVLRQMGKPADALPAHEKALAFRKALADAFPAVAQYQSEWAACQSNIAGTLWDIGKPNEALEAYRKAVATQQALADAHPLAPLYRSDLATTLDGMGWVLLQVRNPTEALEAARRAASNWQALADAYPDNARYKSALAATHNNIGNRLGELGKPEEALKAYRKAVALHEPLVAAHPTVIQYQRFLTNHYANIGRVLEGMGKSAEALEAYSKVLTVKQKLADDHPTVVRYQVELAMVHNDIGELHARQKDFDAAFAALDAGLAIRKKLVEAHGPLPAYTNHLGYSHAARGRARKNAGRPADAAADLRRAVELWDKEATASTNTRIAQARALSQLAGLGGDAMSGVAAAEVAAFTDRAVVALRKAVAAGWSRFDTLKEPDFDPLRNRPDFRAIVETAKK